MAIEVEKLHISLTASTSDYRKNIEDAMSVTDALVNKVKMAMRSLNQVTGKIGMNVDTSGATQSLDELARKLDETHAKIVEKSREIEQAKQAMNGTFKHFGIDSASAQPGLQYIAQLQKEYDELYQQANKYAEAMERVSKNEPTKEEKAGMSALSKEMDTLLQKLTSFNEKLTTGKSTIKEMVTDAKELSKQFGSAASAAQALSKAKVSTKALTQTDSTPKAAAMPKIEPVKQKHVSMIDRARKAMDKLAHSSKKASGSFHGESFMKKLKNFTKSMIIFRGIFYVMSKLGEAMQAAANHSEKTMSALNSAKSASTNLVNSFAVILLPVLKAIAPMLESISRKIVDVANVVAQLFAALFNQKTYQKAIYSSEQWGDTTAGAMDKVAKAQKSIMGFDELNVIQKPQSASGGNDNPLAGGGLTEEMTVDNKFFEATKGIRNFIDDIKDGVKRIAKIYMERIHPHVEKLSGPFKRAMKAIGDAIEGAINFVGDILDGGGAEGIATLVDTIADLVTVASKVKTKMNDLHDWFKDKGVTLGFSAEGVGASIQKVADALHDIVDGLDALLDGNYDKGFKSLVDGLSSLFSFDLIGDFIGEMAKADSPLTALESLAKFGLENPSQISSPVGIIIFNIFAISTAISNVRATFDIMKENMEEGLEGLGKAWEILKNNLVKKWEELKSKVNQKFEDIKNKAKKIPEDIKQFFVNLPGWFAQKFEEAKQRVKEKFDKMKQEASLTVADIKKPFETISTWFSTKFSEVKDRINSQWNTVKNNSSSAASGIKGHFESIHTWFGNKFDSARAQVALKFGEMKNRAYIAWIDIQGVFGNVASWFSNKFGGARDSMVNAFGSLGDALKRPLNAAIQVFNNFINRLNRLSINIPSIMGGGRLSFSIPNITPLATGTVVQPNKPFLAALGDNKREPEIVSPLSTMKQAIREVQNERGGSNSNQDISIAVYVGNDKLVDRTIKGANERALQSGKLILNV